MSQVLPVPAPDGDMPAHLWLPEQGSGPGLLLVQEIFGVSAYIERRAEDLAGLGYVVLAPELFWRLGVSRVESGPSAMEEGVGLLQRLDWDAAVADGVSALEHVRARDEVVGGVGLLGFCLGGGLAFNIAAMAPVDALVSYYGSALPGLLGLTDPQPGVPVLDPASVTAPSLHHFGLADSFIERPVVERLEAALTAVDGVTFLTYEGADHAFDNPDFHLHDEAASRLAWERTVAWLAEHLPPTSP
jgi:carboxymethylenebutenolidase